MAGSAMFAMLEVLTGVGGIKAAGLLAVTLGLAVWIGLQLQFLRATWSRRGPRNVAVIGSPDVAERLRLELAGCSRRYKFVGRIALEDGGSAVEPLRQRRALENSLVEHDVELLLLSSTVPRDGVIDQIVSTCLDLRIQLVELSTFYEAVFRHVPVTEMNGVWFRYMVDASHRAPLEAAKRAIDLAGALLLAPLALPLCAMLVLLIRRDGGPGIFRQERIGERGQTFTLFKLRTMDPSSGAEAQWAAIDDPRVTRIGRLLRHSHLDELPQLLNVLRGEMSLVGPRPEQGPVVQRLEREVPFYDRRHLIRPGLSGWAQIHCGYARSDSGSAWKHCHDLYYLKYRSIWLDLVILAYTGKLVLRGAVRRSEVVPRPVMAITPRGEDASPLGLELIVQPELAAPDGAASGLAAGSRSSHA